MPPILKLLAARSWETFLNVFTTRSAVEFDRFRTSALGPQTDSGEQSPPITNVVPLELDVSMHGDPAATEEAFSKHITEGRFDVAWDLLTPDSQESWHGREAFALEMTERQSRTGASSTSATTRRVSPDLCMKRVTIAPPMESPYSTNRCAPWATAQCAAASRSFHSVIPRWMWPSGLGGAPASLR